MSATREVIDGHAAGRAVALLTRQHLYPDASRAEILDGADPEDVLAAMEAIADGLLAAALPGAAGAVLLRRIGLWAADLEGGTHAR